jgi:Flp pilus assembly pilin Flp
LDDERGSDIVEYALILALVVLAVIGSLYALSRTIFR